MQTSNKLYRFERNLWEKGELEALVGCTRLFGSELSPSGSTTSL